MVKYRISIPPAISVRRVIYLLQVLEHVNFVPQTWKRGFSVVVQEYLIMSFCRGENDNCAWSQNHFEENLGQSTVWCFLFTGNAEKPWIFRLWVTKSKTAFSRFAENVGFFLSKSLTKCQHFPQTSKKLFSVFWPTNEKFKVFLHFPVNEKHPTFLVDWFAKQ